MFVRTIMAGFLAASWLGAPQVAWPSEAGLDLARHFPKRVSVFGVPVHATAAASEEKVRHAASVLAEYLDNDGDGRPDDPLVAGALVERDAALFMARDRDELDRVFAQLEAAIPGILGRTAWHLNAQGITAPDWVWQDLAADETVPGGRGGDDFDGALEEVLHLITHVGFANAYPEAFAEAPGSLIARAMDEARGGHFMGVPEHYPSDAQYSYDDETCVYQCQVTEYFYWALTSLLGAQSSPERLARIGNEWRLNTPIKLRAGDPRMYGLLTDPRFKLPTVLPTGSYTATPLRITPAPRRGSESVVR